MHDNAVCVRARLHTVRCGLLAKRPPQDREKIPTGQSEVEPCDNVCREDAAILPKVSPGKLRCGDLCVIRVLLNGLDIRTYTLYSTLLKTMCIDTIVRLTISKEANYWGSNV